jgi:hypothetical protein
MRRPFTSDIHDDPYRFSLVLTKFILLQLSRCPEIRSNLAEEKTTVEVEGEGEHQVLEKGR